MLAIVRCAVSFLSLFTIGGGLFLSVPAVGLVCPVVAVVSMVRVVATVGVVTVHSAHKRLAMVRAVDMVGIMGLIFVNAVQLLVDIGHPGIVGMVAPIVMIVTSLDCVVHVVLLILLLTFFHLICLIALIVMAIVVDHKISMSGAQTSIWVSHVMFVPTWNVETISSCIPVVTFRGSRILSGAVLSNIIASLLLVVASALVIGQVAPALAASRGVLKCLLRIVDAITLLFLIVTRALVIG